MRQLPKIVIDSAIPYIQGVLEPFFKVEYQKGAQITNEIVKDAAALIIRTRTHCDATLLANSSVKMIATATIGTDHIDLDYCRACGIDVVNAPGCNSSAVRQYVFTALFRFAAQKGISLKNKTLGVIGVGHVGAKVADFAQQLGINVLRNDPPREMAEIVSNDYFTSLDELLVHSDIVTLHIPFTVANNKFANALFFEKIRKNAIFINASRGEVVDEEELLKARNKLGGVILDVWNHEPHINLKLLAAADIATPHIAGYSQQGKINGTVAVVRAVAARFGVTDLQDFALEDKTVKLDFDSLSQYEIERRLNSLYDIESDDAALRSAPNHFEQLREKYDYRIEF